MASARPFMFKSPFLQSYKDFIKESDITAAPSVIMALDKLDANKDAGKRKALVEAAVAAITKWEGDKALAGLQVSIKNLKAALQAGGDKGEEPPPPPQPIKKPAFLPDYSKARGEFQIGAVAAALFELDKVSTRDEAKALAAIALAALEEEAKVIEAEVKGAKDQDRKLKVSQYGIVLRKTIAAMKELQK